MSLLQIYQRLQTIYFVINPQYQLSQQQELSDVENQNEAKQSQIKLQQKQQKIIKNIDLLVQKFQQWITTSFDNQYIKMEQYINLQQSLQKQQSDIRQHIKIEQQMKVYCQKICNQLENMQKSYDYLDHQAENVILNLRKQNKKLILQNRNLKKDITLITQKNSVCSPENTQIGVFNNNLNKINLASSLSPQLITQYQQHYPPNQLFFKKPQMEIDIAKINSQNNHPYRYKYLYYTPMNEPKRNDQILPSSYQDQNINIE